MALGEEVGMECPVYGIIHDTSKNQAIQVAAASVLTSDVPLFFCSLVTPRAGSHMPCTHTLL
jgi:hypothetical protein